MQKFEELEFTERENWSSQIESIGEPEFTDRKWENWSSQIESRRTRVYRKKEGELEFTERKWENWSLQKESGRTGVLD